MGKKFITLVLAYEGKMPGVRLEDKVLGCEVYGMSRGDEIEKRCELEERHELEEQEDDQESSWIPVSNPPAEGKRVLVMLTTGEVWAGHYDGENWTVHVMGVCNSITHWMPIPKLPKDKL